MAGTILKLGWTNPLTGTFGDSPVLGPVIDLNDGVTFTLAADGVELEAPTRTLVTAGNVRTQGERATRGIYRHNRRLVARVLLGPMASSADLIANIRALVQWVSAPPALPVTLHYQPPGAALPVYADVVGCAHTIPSDESQWLRLQLEEIELVFLVRPGLRGDRVTLSNLAVNPGFEAPMGGGTAQVLTTVFSDSFATANAYTLVSGSAPSIASNVMTVQAGSRIKFGSPAWGAVAQWQLRWQFQTSLQAEFYLHFTDTSNYLALILQSTGSASLNQRIASVDHTLASGSITLANGNWYWLRFTQFPTAPGDPPDVQVTLYADASGAVGAPLAGGSLGPVATSDAATALAGYASLVARNAAMNIGGAYAGVHQVQLFGPGAWLYNGANGGTGAGAWDGTRGELGMSGTATAGTQTYAGGPVASFAAARMDFPPSGTMNGYWESYSGGAPAGTNPIPVTAGTALSAGCVAKSGGLSASAQVTLQIREWDASGSLLRATTLQALSGNQSGWASLSGTVTTGASCAYISVLLGAQDSTTGSANGTVWFDNVQIWNVTTTGQASMPYCELRFPNSPAQLVVSGLLGDLPVPAYVACGTYLASWPAGSVLSLLAGRRGQVSSGAQLVSASCGFYGTAFSPQATAVLDAASYGGYYAQALVTSAGWNPRAFSPHPADALGTYHLFERHLTKQALGNLANVQVRVVAQQLSDSWYGSPNGTDQLGAYTGAWSTPLTASNTWTLVDAGQVALPPLNAGALTDLTQTYATPRPQWTDATGGGENEQANWQMLLPVDGSLVVGTLNNPSNAPFGVTNQWLWSYFDGLAVSGGGSASWTYSLESAPTANPAHAGGGPGTQSSGAINLNSGADPYLTLDPAPQIAGNGGVNTLVACVTDGAGTVLPLHIELQYAPLYLWPR